MKPNNYKILSYKKGNWFISVSTVGTNNGKLNQSYNLCIQANINIVERLSDGAIITANNTRYKTKISGSFYITHM